MRLLGITMAYNEADCIANSIVQLVKSGHEVHVFDHGSTDGTADVCYQYVKRCQVRYHYLDRTDVPAARNGIKALDLWRRIGRFVLDRRDSFDWVTWLASDEILRQPDGRLLTKEAIEREAARGIQVIRPLIRDFAMSTADDVMQRDYLHRLRHYIDNPIGHAPRCWDIDLTPEKMPGGLHIQDPATGKKVHGCYGRWPDGTKVSNNEWILYHYPLRTMAQAKRKVMKERDWITLRGTRRYAELRANKCRGAVVRRPSRCGYKCERRRLPMPMDHED